MSGLFNIHQTSIFEVKNKKKVKSQDDVTLKKYIYT